MFECSCVSVGMQILAVPMWRSEDNLGCQSLPGTLFEAGSLLFVV